MARHLMLDLETMAVSPDATILTLGAVTLIPTAMGTVINCTFDLI